MTVTEAIRHTVQTQKHILAHELSEEIFAQVEAYIAEGYRPEDLRAELHGLLNEYREDNQEILRDALIEVIVELDELAA